MTDESSADSDPSGSDEPDDSADDSPADGSREGTDEATDEDAPEGGPAPSDDDSVRPPGPGERGRGHWDAAQAGEDPRDLPPGHPGRGGERARPRAEEHTHSTEGGEATDADGAPGPGGVDGPPGLQETESTDDAGEPVTVNGHGAAGAGVTPDEGPGSGGDTDRSTGGLDAPPDDEERPLEEHVEEMVQRLAIVVGVFAVGTAVAFPVTEELIDFLWRGFLPPGERPHVYGPLEFLFTKFLVAGLAGLVLALPAFVYQTYRFMRPGLYPHERRYYLASVPTSLVLAGLGIAFAYFLVLPAIFAYFTTYTQEAATIAFGLRETFNLIVMLMAALAFVFQIPLFVMLAIMMGVTDRRWLEDRRLYFWGGFLGVAFIFTPDPTGMAPVLVAATMVGLFEGTLLLLRWTARGAFSPAGLAARRPYVWGLAVVVGYAAGPSPVPTGYRASIPDAVIGTLDALGILAGLPALVALLVAGLYEALTLTVQRIRALRIQLALLRARPVVWILAGLLGYAATPDPLPLRAAAAVALPIPWAVGVTALLIAAFEVGLYALRRQRDHRTT